MVDNNILMDDGGGNWFSCLLRCVMDLQHSSKGVCSSAFHLCVNIAPHAGLSCVRQWPTAENFYVCGINE